MGDMLTLVRGDNSPHAQRVVYDYDPVRGYIVIQEFKGASQAYMLGLQQNYVANGIANRLTYEHDMAILEIHDSTQTYTLDTWQIEGNELDIDGFSHPSVLAVLANQSAPDDLMAAIRTALAAETKFSAITDAAVTGLAAGDKATIQSFYLLNQKGSPNYRRQQYVLRHTTNVSNRSMVNYSDFNVDRIYTPAQLISELYASSGFVVPLAYPLPPRLQTKLNAIPALGPQSGYLWGWLKIASTESTAANNRIDITTLYTCELWSTDYYKLVGT
jgi:hypothetical protein